MNSKYELCYLSERGHNNFWYPTQKRAFINRNCDYTQLAWLGGLDRNLVPLKVSEACITTFKKDSDINHIVVWVRKESLPLAKAS